MKKRTLKLVMSAFLGVTMLASCGNSEGAESKEKSHEMTDGMETVEFKVYGNCGMCEKTIEGSLNGQDGIGKADWDKETKMISVTYNPKNFDENKIKEKIAGVGYDTDSHRADESVYNSLPGCCQYERPE